MLTLWNGLPLGLISNWPFHVKSEVGATEYIWTTIKSFTHSSQWKGCCTLYLKEYFFQSGNQWCLVWVYKDKHNFIQFESIDTYHIPNNLWVCSYTEVHKTLGLLWGTYKGGKKYNQFPFKKGWNIDQQYSTNIS